MKEKTLPDNIDKEVLSILSSNSSLLHSISDGWRVLSASMIRANESIEEYKLKITELEKQLAEKQGVS